MMVVGVSEFVDTELLRLAGWLIITNDNMAVWCQNLKSLLFPLTKEGKMIAPVASFVTFLKRFVLIGIWINFYLIVCYGWDEELNHGRLQTDRESKTIRSSNLFN